MDVVNPDLAVGETFWGKVFDCQSKGQGAIRTGYPTKHEFAAWEYTRHNNGPLPGELPTDDKGATPAGFVRSRQNPLLPKGLSTTRFHKGFQRRKQSHIGQDKARLEREECKQRASLVHLHSRRQRLGSLDKRNGFNLITGQFDKTNNRCTTPFHIEPRTRQSGSLSSVAERAEYLLLRDSEYKFHAPAWSGKNHDKRQDLLQREGINKAKKSALLGIGSADLASVGAEDMFSKAVYDPAKACAVQGLVETSVPGRFTPRKLAENPTVPITADSAATDNNVIINNNNNNNNNNPGFPPKQDASFIQNTVDSRGMLSTPEPTAVFRVIPTGLGYRSSHRAGRGAEGGVPGIAPLKRFSGSQSAPTLGQEPQARNSRVLPPGAGMPRQLLLPIRSTPNTGGGSWRGTNSAGDRSPRRARGGGGRDTNSKNGDQKSTPAAAVESPHGTRRRARLSDTGSDRCDTIGSGGRLHAEESERNSSALSLTPIRSRSRSLSRSHSDFTRDSRCGDDDAAREYSHDASRTGALQNSSSLERLSPYFVDGRKGSGRSRCNQSRSETQAQRRNVDQLALDFAAVRSLEP